MRQSEGNSCEPDRERDPGRLLKQCPGGDTEILNAQNAQRIGSDQNPEQQCQHRTGQADSLRQRGEGREQEDRPGKEREDQVDVHVATTAQVWR